MEDVTRLRCRVARYCLIEEVLYRKRLSFLYLKCLEAGQAEYVLSEIHQGIYNNHYEVSVLAHKALR